MSEEIEFSIMGDNAANLQPLLDQFEAEQHIHVRLRTLPWDTGWSTLVKAALYNDGPDVSEIGTTWLGDLIGMNAPRAFNAAEVVTFGKAGAFLPLAWRTCTQFGDSHVWAIPWLVGARLIYYRQDLLEAAGLEAKKVFSSNQNLLAALAQLHACGVAHPWTVPTGATHTTILNAASWVWEAGGGFIREDGKGTRFTEPAALEGLRAYFNLGRFLSPAVRPLNGLEPDHWFLTHADTAMTISGPWLFCQAQQQMEPEQLRRMQVVLPPGPAFVGGSNLIIWKYSAKVEAAVKLIRFLTQAGTQAAYSRQIGLLPARLEALSAPPFSTDLFWQTAAAGLHSGRAFRAIRLWGLVEERLTSALAAVWADMLSAPELDAAEPLARHLPPVARRLDYLLSQS